MESPQQVLPTSTKNNKLIHKLRSTKSIRTYTLLTILASLWGISYSLFGPETTNPTSDIFRLTSLFLLSKLAGLTAQLIRLPPMLGMLLTGILLRNTGYILIQDENYIKLTSALRQLALINIMLIAGLGLDGASLKRMSGMVAGLAVLAPTVEILSVTILAPFLIGLPWLWSLLLGLLLGAVSPALVIPCLLDLEKRGYGRNKGVHTLVIAASAVDDIGCIAAFGVVASLIFSTGSISTQVLEGPVVVVMGVGYGVLVGVFSWGFPDGKDSYVVSLRSLVIGASSLLAVFGSQAVGYEGAGTLACILTAFVASIKWRRRGWNKNVSIYYSSVGPWSKSFVFPFKSFKGLV